MTLTHALLVLFGAIAAAAFAGIIFVVRAPWPNEPGEPLSPSEHSENGLHRVGRDRDGV